MEYKVHDRMSKILSKKRDLSPMEHSAKMDVVKQMRDMAASEMGGKLDGIKKVSVMSNDKDGLEKGLSKAKEIVSSGEMDQMKNHAENDLADYDSAVDEHADDEDNEDDGSENNFSEGGPVLDPDKAQSAQDSMRKAFKFNEGGEVPESEDESEESDESPEEASEDNLEGLDIDALKEKIKHLMAMHKSMGSK